MSRLVFVTGFLSVLGIIAIQTRSQIRLQAENAAFRERLGQVEELRAEDVLLTRQQLAEAEARASEEINRLRNEVRQLRQKTNEFTTLQRQAQAAATALERQRWQTEFLSLKQEFTGKPRVPRIGAWIGVTVGNISEHEPDVDRPEGTIVRMLVPNGPAAVSKIQPGDIIVSVDGEAVRDTEHFKALLSQKPGAQTISLGIVREGAQLAIAVNASDWPQ